MGNDKYTHITYYYNPELEQAKNYINKLEQDLETERILNYNYKQRIIDLEQMVDSLRAQIQNLTSYLE